MLNDELKWAKHKYKLIESAKTYYCEDLTKKIQKTS